MTVFFTGLGGGGLTGPRPAPEGGGGLGGPLIPEGGGGGGDFLTS